MTDTEKRGVCFSLSLPCFFFIEHGFRNGVPNETPFVLTLFGCDTSPYEDKLDKRVDRRMI